MDRLGMNVVVPGYRRGSKKGEATTGRMTGDLVVWTALEVTSETRSCLFL